MKTVVAGPAAAAAGAVDGAEPVVARWPNAAPDGTTSSIVGRARELADLRHLAIEDEPRFITLVGIGGVGKSRLAAELAARELAARDGRIAVVPLDGVNDASLVLPAIAGALGVADEPGRSLADALAEELGVAPTLLVLDTVEHVRSAGPALADLRARTAGLTILATSRVALGVPRERVVWVEPLPVPADGESDPDTLLDNPAAALFLDRARAVRPELEATPANTALVASITRRLDGIPLAIELAAAALRVLAPHQLLDQLDDRMADHLGDDHDPTGPARQRSIRAAMDWSVSLLPEPVLRLHRRMAVIAGAFDAATAASIVERGERRGLAPLGIEVAEGLRQLAAASLLRTDHALTPGGGGAEKAGRDPRYAMLTTVRADALDRLQRSGEAVAMRWAHAYEVLAVAEAAELDFPTEREVEALDQLDALQDDIREALDWASTSGDGTFAVRLAGALAEFWRTRGHHTEGRLRLAAALALATDAPAPFRRKALGGAGLLASYQGDYGLGEAYLRQALAVAREEGNREAEATILNWLGTNAYGGGDLDAAEAWVSESLAIRRELGEPAGIASALNALGGVHHFRGDLDRAREMFLESLELKQQLGNANTLAVSLTNLGLLERDAGRPEDAREAFEEAVAIWERTGDRQRLSVGVHNTALLDLDCGLYDDAASKLDRALELAEEVGDRNEVAYALADRVRLDVERGRLDEAAQALDGALRRSVAIGARVILPLALEGGGSLAAARGEDALAVRLWAAATTERRESGFVNMPADERLLDRRMDDVRGRLDPDAFAEAWTAGLGLGVPAAVDEAMTLVRATGRPRRPRTTPGGRTAVSV